MQRELFQSEFQSGIMAIGNHGDKIYSGGVWCCRWWLSRCQKVRQYLIFLRERFKLVFLPIGIMILVVLLEWNSSNASKILNIAPGAASNGSFFACIILLILSFSLEIYFICS